MRSLNIAFTGLPDMVDFYYMRHVIVTFDGMEFIRSYYNYIEFFSSSCNILGSNIN